MINWEEIKGKYKRGFVKCSDQELVKSFNGEVGCGGWGTARMYYLHYLSRELRNRRFNSDIIFELDAEGNIKAMKLSRKVVLKNNRLKFID